MGKLTPEELAALRKERAIARWADPAFREKMAKVTAARWSRPGEREKVAAMARATANNPDRCTKLSAARKAYLANPEHREALTSRIRARFEDPVYREQNAERMRKMSQDPARAEIRSNAAKIRQANLTEEQQASHIARSKARWQTKEYREKMEAAIQEYYSDPAVHVQRSEDLKKRRPGYQSKIQAVFDTPEYSAKRTKINQQRWANPEYKAKVMGRLKAAWANHPERAKKQASRLLGKMPNFSKYRCWYDGPNGLIFMRCKWEVAYAQFLDRGNIRWEYESRWFSVGKGPWPGVTYTPDFYIVDEDRYVDVKGHFPPVIQQKIAQFRKRHPKIRLDMLYQSNLEQMGVVKRGRGVLTEGQWHPADWLPKGAEK